MDDALLNNHKLENKEEKYNDLTCFLDELSLPIQDIDKISNKPLSVSEDLDEIIESSNASSQKKNSILKIDDNSELLFQGTTNLMLYLDVKGRIIKINKAGIDFSGFSEEEITGKKFWKLPGVFSISNLSAYLRVFKNTFKGEITKNFISELYDKTGKKHIMNFSTYPLTQHSKTESILVIGEDITRKEKTEKRYNLIVEHTSDLISVTTFSLNPVYTYVSPSNSKIYGFTADELIGKNGFDFIHPDDKKRLRPLLKKYLIAKTKKLLTGKETDIVEKVEFRFKDKAGNWHDLISTVNIIEDELLFVSKDVTEKKQAEQKLKETSKHLKNIIDSSPSAIVIVDKKGKITGWNKASEEIFGWEKNEVIGRFNPTVPDEMKKLYFKTMKEKHVNLPLKVDRKNRSKIDISLSTTPLYNDQNEFIGALGIMTDITKQRKAEQQAKKTKKEMENLLNSSSNGIRVVTKDFTVKTMNKTMAEMSGVSIKQGTGMKCSDMFGSKHCGTEHCSMIRVLKQGIGFEEENIRINWQGQKIHCFDSVTPYTDEQGNLIGIIEDFRDISPIKKAELQLKKQLNELKRYKEVTIGREMRVIELKKEINDLCRKYNEPVKYSSTEEKLHEKKHGGKDIF